MIRKRRRHSVSVRSSNTIWENNRPKAVSTTVWKKKFRTCQDCLNPGAWRTLSNGTSYAPAGNLVEHRLRKTREANGVDDGDVLAAMSKERLEAR